jgi:protocatechuate 4,5-dioxygenase beta chain
MAKIVCGFTVPHAPMMCGAPNAPSLEQRTRCWDGFERVTDRLKERDVDTVIVIGDDHYIIFGPKCLPSALIGIGDIDGPAEPWLNTPKVQIENNSALAQHIMRYGHKNGVDWAVAKSLTLDHSTYVPYHYGVRPVAGLKMIPIYLATGVEPLIDSRRCYQIGQSIAAAVDCWDSAERVAVFGTGGGAHWPGTADMQRLEPEYDRSLLALLEQGNVEALVGMSDEQVAAEAGNGGWELKNWLCMLGCLGEVRGKVFAYEAVPEWMGSCAYVEMQMAA